MQPQQFSLEDVQQILATGQTLSSQISNTDKVFSEQELKEMASELSIDEGDLKQAIITWQTEKTREQQKQQQRQRFYQQHLLPYAAVNTFLLLLNIYLAGAVTWSIYSVLGWGLGLFLGPFQRMLKTIQFENARVSPRETYHSGLGQGLEQQSR